MSENLNMSDDKLILEVINPSRKLIQVGDLFTLKPKGVNYYYGRVINTDAQIGGFENVIMCYVYAASSINKADVPKLDKNNLLIPPFGIDRSPWTVGCFETIATNELLIGDSLESHAFKSHLSDTYFNEFGIEVTKPARNVGYFSVSSSITIDYAIGNILGLVT